MMTTMPQHQDGCDLVAEVRCLDTSQVARWALRRALLKGRLYFGGEAYPYTVAMDQVVRTEDGNCYIWPIRLSGNRQIARRMLPGDAFRSRLGREIIVGRICRSSIG